MAVAVAIPFALHVPDAYWMAIATIVALRPSLEQSAFVAEQRVAGALLGAAVAALLLLTVHDTYVLVAAVLVLGAAAGSVRLANYALYCAGIAAAVLIAIDLPNPTNLSAEVRRIAFTLAGVGLAVVVSTLLDRLQKRKRSPREGQVAAPAH